MHAGNWLALGLMMACAEAPTAQERVDLITAAPPTITVHAPGTVRIGQVANIVIDGSLGQGERVYLGGRVGAGGAGPCLPSAGGLCLSLGSGAVLVGTRLADASGSATFAVTIPPALPVGTLLTIQALAVRGFGGTDSLASAPVTLVAVNGPPEGTVLNDWTAFDFADDGYRDGCAGGAKYVKSTGYADAAYVGVTLCDDYEYKIWLGDALYGTFVSPADWSGSGEDHCEYVGGVFLDHPQGSTSVTGGEDCWSRGPAGVDPVYEPVCASNRWIPSSYDCDVAIPSVPGFSEGDVLTEWTAFDFRDDGYRDGCAGGAKYVKSTGLADADYVGVTICTDTTYKIWLSDRLLGTFHSPGDWSGSGEDHCDYVGGTFDSFPAGATAVDGGASCWSRGPAGVEPVYEATCVSNRWIAPVHACNVRIPPPPGPAEGSVLATWTAFDFLDNGYRDGCAGGTKYIKSTSWGDPAYVAVTLCSADTYKIWLGDSIYGAFVSAGDWSGSGEDQCEYVGGSHLSFPQGSTAADAGQPCWSRGPAGVQPVYEPSCATNRWIAPAQQCSVLLP